MYCPWLTWLKFISWGVISLTEYMASPLFITLLHSVNLWCQLGSSIFPTTHSGLCQDWVFFSLAGFYKMIGNDLEQSFSEFLLWFVLNVHFKTKCLGHSRGMHLAFIDISYYISQRMSQFILLTKCGRDMFRIFTNTRYCGHS